MGPAGCVEIAALPGATKRSTSSPWCGESLKIHTCVIYSLCYVHGVQTEHSLDATLGALADPTRRAILARLAEGEATVSDLARPFAISQPAVSRHIKVLTEAGLIVQRVDGTRRPCRLAPGALSELEEYLALLRRALETNYQRLDRLLRERRKRKESKT